MSKAEKGWYRVTTGALKPNEILFALRGSDTELSITRSTPHGTIYTEVFIPGEITYYSPYDKSRLKDALKTRKLPKFRDARSAIKSLEAGLPKQPGKISRLFDSAINALAKSSEGHIHLFPPFKRGR